jgi:hypothetical protein
MNSELDRLASYHYTSPASDSRIMKNTAKIAPPVNSRAPNRNLKTLSINPFVLRLFNAII